MSETERERETEIERECILQKKKHVDIMRVS